MPLQLVTAPQGEPVALELALAMRKQDAGNDDVVLNLLISASRDFAENETRRALIAARFRLVLDAFPGPSLTGVPYGEGFTIPGHAILLPRNPVIQVVSIQYTAMDGTTQTMASTDYAVDLASEPARITPVFGKIWPITLPQIGSVQVLFDAGYAAPVVAVPAADTIQVKGWKALAVNDTVRLSNSGGALPAPLALATDYFVKTVVSPGVYTLAATAGGAQIDITDVGTGLHFLGEVPKGLVNWMLLRLGSLDANREEVAIMSRGKIDPLPYIDNLLDPFRVWTA